MTHLPVEDFTNFLTGQFGLVVGTNLHKGSISDAPGFPVDCVFVRSAGGIEPLRSMAEATELRNSILDIRIRDAKHKAGELMGQNILNSLNGIAGLPSGYLDAVPLQGEPLDAGTDERGRHIFALNIRLAWSEAT